MDISKSLDRSGWGLVGLISLVVSSSTGPDRRIIHYDSGKTIQNQSLVRTGALDAPPMILPTTLSVTGARHEQKGHPIADISKV